MEAPPLSPIFSASAKSTVSTIRRISAPLLLLSGVAVLGYAGYRYGTMLSEQRHLQAVWQLQQIRNHSAGKHSAAALHDASLTRISIPSIRLTAVIVEGTDDSALLIGPGHLSGTAQPGEAGNSVVSAHRDTFFRNIANLSPGDPIVVERDGRTFIYEVAEFKIVKPTDVSVAANTGDNRLTLVTCDPAIYFGPAPQRLVVISKLVSPATPPGVEVAKAAGKRRPSHIREKRAN
jgi:sortase A